MFIRSGPEPSYQHLGEWMESVLDKDIAIVFSCHWASWSHIPLLFHILELFLAQIFGSVLFTVFHVELALM